MRTIEVFAERWRAVVTEEERQAVFNQFRRQLFIELEENDRVMWENNVNKSFDEVAVNEELTGEHG